MDSEKYGTSDVKWNWTDPKTVTLSNTPPPMPPPGLPETPALTNEAERIRAMTGVGMSPSETANMKLGMQMRERQREPTPAERANAARAQRREHRQGLRNFDKYLQAGGTSTLSGIQELVESGALTITEDGNVYTSVPFRGKGDLLGAAGQWADFQSDVQMEMSKLGPDATQEQRQKLFQDMLLEREHGQP
jgi:hypothetical protein